MKKWMLLICLCTPALANADVTFYRDCDYGGTGIELAPGDYTARELLQFGLPQDAISSIDVPRGLSVTLYEDDLFKGRYGTLRRSDPCLTNDRFDNIVSSLSIRETFDTSPESSTSVLPTTTLTATNAVTLFTDCSYRGQSAALTAGDYNLAQLKNAGIDNNTLSSVRVPEGFTITLYENDFLRGRAGRLKQDDECLKNDRFDDVVSSISIRQDGLEPTLASPSASTVPDAPIVLYTQCDYKGTSVALKEGSYTATQLKGLGIDNNSISSIRVGIGYQIELFENDFYRGRSGTLRQNDTCLVDDRFNDFISSIKVTRDTKVPVEQTQATQNGATFFAHCDFKGGSVALPPGRYDRKALANKRISDNVISSLKITEGFQVTLYDDVRFKGNGVLFIDNDKCLSDNGLDERVSSLVVEPVAKQTSPSLAELLPPKPTSRVEMAAVKKALDCIEQYVERDLCDSQRWRDMNKRCSLADAPLLTDGFLRGHVEAGNCREEYWDELSRRVANPRLR